MNRDEDEIKNGEGISADVEPLVLGQLPECVVAQVMKCSGTAGASALSLVCPELYQNIWENIDVWQAFLGCTAFMSATALRDEHRWACYGIDTLCGWRKRPPAAGHAVALKSAHRAIHGLIPEDAPRRIENVVAALADLLRWYDATDNEAHKSARELVRAVTLRPEVFSADHVHELRRALGDSRVLRKTLRAPPSPVTNHSSDSDAGPFSILFEDDAFAAAETASSDGDMTPVSCAGSCFGLAARCADAATCSGPDECVMDRVLTALRAVPSPDADAPPCGQELESASGSLWRVNSENSMLMPMFPSLVAA